MVKLLTCPVFALAVLSAATLQASHAMYYCFGTISFQTAGYAGGTIGLLWSVGVLAEILVFAASSTFKKVRVAVKCQAFVSIVGHGLGSRSMQICLLFVGLDR